MKIAVLSDIHGNVPALEAVLADLDQWGPERVVVNGDLINRGPNSLPVLQMLLERLPTAVFLKGNHETYVLQCLEEDFPRDGPRYEMHRFAWWTFHQLGEEMRRVASWAANMDLTDLDGGSLHFTHGSRLGNRDGISPRTTDEELPAKLGDRRDLFVASHTHLPMIRDFQGVLVVNSGSVGAPFDRDPRSAYARLSFSRGRWLAEIRRLEYDRERAMRDYEESGFCAGGGPLTRVMLKEMELSRGLMAPWLRAYRDAVSAGELTLEASVERFLAQC